MERRQHLNETPGSLGRMVIEFDLASGRVHSASSGFWSMRQVQAFFVDWGAVVRQIHLNGVAVSALVDMSESQVQKAEVAEYIMSATTGLYKDGDSVAMLMPTSLAKMQMRRVLDMRVHDFFPSRDAAETWLDARRREATPRGRSAA